MSQCCHADTWAWGDVSPRPFQCWGRGCWTWNRKWWDFNQTCGDYIIVHLRFLNSISLKIQVLAIFHFSWGMLRSAIWVTNLSIISWSSKLGRIQPVVLQDPLKDPEFWRNPNLPVCCWPIHQTLTVINYDAGVWSSPRSRTAQFWFSSLANLRETNIICSSAVTYWHAITIQSSYRHFLCRYWSWYISSHLIPSLHCLDMRTRRSIVSCSCRSEQPVVEPNPEPGATLWKHWPFEGSMNRKSHGEIIPAYCPKMAVRPHRKYAKIIENHSKKNIWEAFILNFKKLERFVVYSKLNHGRGKFHGRMADAHRSWSSLARPSSGVSFSRHAVDSTNPLNGDPFGSNTWFEWC